MGININSKFQIIGKVKATLRDAKTNEIKHCTGWCKNLITNAGYDAILRRLGNIALRSNEGMITYGAVGTGTSTPSASDTQMESELERKLLAVTSESNQVLEIEVFFTTAEANGTITKFALFGEEATAAADSGTMFEYADFVNSFTKTTNETLIIEIEIQKA